MRTPLTACAAHADPSGGSGKKAGEFYTPQRISDILSAIVTLDSQEPKAGPRKRLESVSRVVVTARAAWPARRWGVVDAGAGS